MAAKTENELLKERVEFDASNGNSQHVFYNPFKKANGVVEVNARKITFVPHGVPKGWALDVAGWEADGESGPAKPYRIVAATPKVKPCKEPGGCKDCPECKEAQKAEEPVAPPAEPSEDVSEAEPPAEAKE